MLFTLPCLDSTAELVLMMGVQVSSPEGESMGELSLPSVCCEVMCVARVSPHPYHLLQSGQLDLRL